MGLPLLIAIIGYSVIIFFLTVWLTKYHDYHCRISHPKGRIDKEASLETQLGNPETKSPKNNPAYTDETANESRTTPPSGKESFSENDEGGV